MMGACVMAVECSQSLDCAGSVPNVQTMIFAHYVTIVTNTNYDIAFIGLVNLVQKGNNIIQCLFNTKCTIITITKFISVHSK